MERRQRPFFKELPSEELDWPRVESRPAAPTPPSFSMYLPMMFAPVLMGVVSYFFQQSFSLMQLGASVASGIIMGGLYVGAMLWSYRRQKRAYEEKIQQRKQAFLAELERLEQRAQRLAHKQRKILHKRYPGAQEVLSIVFNPKNWRKRLWMREEHEEDFLRLRVGTGTGEPSFHFATPAMFSKEDHELEVEVHKLRQRWAALSDLPLVLDLKKNRSVLLRGDREALRPLAYRLLLDVVVHHSPRKVRVGLIADKHGRLEKAWGWMRWLPHTYALEIPSESLLAFGPDDAYRLLDVLKQRVEAVLQEEQHARPARPENYTVIFFDDAHIRTNRTVAFLVEEGYKAGIYLVFIGDETTPTYPTFSEIRPRRDGSFYMRAQVPQAEQAGQDEKISTLTQKGTLETVARETIEKVARILAGIEPPEPLQDLTELPTMLPLADLLAHVYADLSQDTFFATEDNEPVQKSEDILAPWLVKAMWARFQEALTQPDAPLHDEAVRHLITFPIGLSVRQGRLRPSYLNLLPEGSRWGGYAAYHTILIGPTGSGKSEFIKSLIWGGAFRYPPSLFNVYFIDFKGGAALEDLKYRRTTENGHEQEILLPHIVGLVTNPDVAGEEDLSGRAVSLRGIDALRRELDRRMRIITKEGKSKDIWEYNRKNPDRALPHLLIILDEFSKALQDFPELGQLLENLVRLGRSLGMYLILANQNVTQAVTRLLANVGWRIALRMSGSDLREVLGEALSDIGQVGRGYLMCVPTGEIQMFQSPYGGVPLAEDTGDVEEYSLYALTPTGRNGILSTIRIGDSQNANGSPKAKRTQGRALTETLCRVALEAGDTQQPRPIYLEPLPARISLMEVFDQEGGPLAFREGVWLLEPDRVLHWRVPFGLMDNLDDVHYDVTEWALDEADGHLLVMGVPTSGREQVVEALLAALAHRYTPEEVHMYVLDFGVGALRNAEDLPHMGAYIDAANAELRYRLFRLLQQTYTERKTNPKEDDPHLLLVLFDFHARQVMDILDDEDLQLLYRLLQEGPTRKIHLVFVTSGPQALRDEWAGVLSRRFILELGQKDDYPQAGLPRQGVLPLTRKAPGRGYWVTGRGETRQIREAQAAWVPWNAFLSAMHSWEGRTPKKLQVLPTCLPWEEWLRFTATDMSSPDTFPLGLDFETFAPVTVQLYQNPPVWLISGPAQKGKTHFLLLWAQTALRHKNPQSAEPVWDVFYVGLKPLPEQVRAWEEEPRMRFFVGKDQWDRAWDAVQNHLRTLQETASERRLLLLLDDVPDTLKPVTGDLVLDLREALGKHLYLLVATRDANEAQRGLNFDAEKTYFLKAPRDEGIGLAFSAEGILDFYPGINRRAIKKTWKQAWQQAPAGRAFFLYRGKLGLLQVPTWLPCPAKDSS